MVTTLVCVRNPTSVPRSLEPPRGSQQLRVGARQDNTKCTREQEYAPPAGLSEGTLSLFSDGSASYDKELKGWVSAGFGFVAVEGGDGPEHTGGRSIHEHQGPVDRGDFGGAVQNRRIM